MITCKCGRVWYSTHAFAAHCRWSQQCRYDPADIIARDVNFTEDGCWIWTGHAIPSKRSPNWYGRLSINGVKWAAHRWAYVVIAGKEIPEDHELDHLCQTTLCINPAHLEPVDKEEHEIRTRARVAARAPGFGAEHPDPW